MNDDADKFKIEIENLKAQNHRQQSIIDVLLKEIEIFQGQSSDTPYIQCFFAMPFDQEYDKLFDSVKSILEDAPYGWKVIRADTEHKAPTIHMNVEKHIANSHCYIADISEKNVNVFLEIGRISHYSKISDFDNDKYRPLIYLCNKNSKNTISSDLQGLIYHSYEPLNSDCLKSNNFIEGLEKEFKKQSNFGNLRNAKEKEAYLSHDILLKYKVCSTELASKIISKFSTVESFLRPKAADTANQLHIPKESSTILCIKYFLSDHFLIKLSSF